MGWPKYLTIFIPLAIALKLAGANETLIFVTSALGVIPTAALMGRATEELAARSGPGIGGFLNVTFGNAPELIIALFALGKGLHEVVKASLVGSILGNVLLVLGRGDVRRRPGPRPPGLQPHGGLGAVVDAAARRRGDHDARGLHARLPRRAAAARTTRSATSPRRSSTCRCGSRC